MRTGCVVTLWNDVGHISGARKCQLAAIVGRVLDMGTVCAESALHHPTLTVKRPGLMWFILALYATMGTSIIG